MYNFILPQFSQSRCVHLSKVGDIPSQQESSCILNYTPESQSKSQVQSSSTIFSTLLSQDELTKDMSIQENIKAVRRAIEALNTGDTTNVHHFISPDYINKESQSHKDSYRSKLKGPEEFIDTIKNLRSAFSDLHYEEQEIISQGNKVIFVGNVTGTHTGNFFFIPPTRNKISYAAVHIHTIGDDGKIVEHRSIRDDLKFMYQQLLQSSILLV